MISHLEKEIALRYLKTRKKDGFLNIISIFSFIGISLGVAVLIIVMSVMNGFRTELIEKIVGFNAHAVIKPYAAPINKDKFSNKELKKISKKILFSNNGEGIIVNKDYFLVFTIYFSIAIVIEGVSFVGAWIFTFKFALLTASIVDFP